MFIGRDAELRMLEDAYRSAKSELVIVYGRRRIGKSALIRKFAENKPHAMLFEALEQEHTDVQLMHFSTQLARYLAEPLLKDASFKDWEQAFDYLTRHAIQQNRGKEKRIIALDELQWMAAGKNTLVGLLKYYWDNHWKQANCMLILCGSISSFMIRHVIRSKALYGRAGLELNVKGLYPYEARRLFNTGVSDEDALKYLLIFGGVPKYLEELSPHKSFNQNMNALCFSKNGVMVNEPAKIFHSQFRQPGTYVKILKHIVDRGYCTAKEVGLHNGIPSGGGLSGYLENLLHADIIMSCAPFGKPRSSKLVRYGLADEFLHFYFKYMEPHRDLAALSRTARVFETVTKSGFDSWLGFSFERFCRKHAGHLADIMGFSDTVAWAGPHFGKTDRHFQIDLLYKRTDNVITLCEIKHVNSALSPTVIPAVESKKKLLSIPRGYTVQTALICLYGPDNALEHSRYFDHIVTLKDIFGEIK